MADQEITLKPGQKIKPSISNEIAQKLVQKLFNLESTSIKELNSYDDRNFHVKVKDSSHLPDPNDACPQGYILKILNSLDSKATNLIDAMNQMMLFLNKNGIPCPKPVKNIHGTLMSLEELKIQVDETWLENNDANSGEPTDKYIVRLLTYIPGEIFFNVPYTQELFFQVGETAAKIDLALMGFKHEGLIGVERAWNLSFVPKLTDFTFAIQDDKRRALVTEVIEGFKSSVVPCYANLQSGPIHGDLNEQNILVSSVGDKYAISGILDFGDIHCNYYVFELAIATCYMMIECKSMDILDVPGHVLAGYQRLRPIPDLELELLKDCISGRFCQSLVLGAYSYMQGPDPYLLTTAKRGWHCLETLWKSPKDELLKRWRAIMLQYENST